MPLNNNDIFNCCVVFQMCRYSLSKTIFVHQYQNFTPRTGCDIDGPEKVRTELDGFIKMPTHNLMSAKMNMIVRAVVKHVRKPGGV